MKNIDDSVTDEELLKLFSEQGTVANAKIMREGNDVSRGNYFYQLSLFLTTFVYSGFGFVCFVSAEDAVKAISALNGHRLRSKPLVVTLHQPRNVRLAHLAATFGSRYDSFSQ